MTKKENKPLLTRTTYQERQKDKKNKKREQISKITVDINEQNGNRKKKWSTFNFPTFNRKQNPINPEDSQKEDAVNIPGERLTKKEQGRRLDHFYNWSIFLILIAIVLVFVLAFVI